MALITTAGLAGVAKVLNGTDSEAAFTYVAVGSGSTAAAVGDTALVTEHTTGGLERTAATCTTTGATTRWVAEFTNTSGGALVVREIGVFNADTGGTMLLRHVYDADETVAAGDTIRVTVTDTHSQGS